jgi:hypothetical protein
MLKINIQIQQNGINYNGNNTSWVEAFTNNIYQKNVKLSDKEFDDYAEGIKQSIERNIFTSMSFTGSKLPVLKPSTIKRKGHSKQLFDKGVLYRSIKTGKIPHGREIFVSGARDSIAFILQKRFPFFGIIPERADAILQHMISRSPKRKAA